MADKTWTAVDVKLGPLKITPQGGTLHIERRYVFLDSDSNVMTQIKGDSVIIDVEFVSLPTSIQDALTTINAWTKNQALIQEGME